MTEKEYVVLPSLKSLTAIGLISAFLSPIVGLIIGFYFLRRPQLNQAGKYILLVAAAWIGVIFFLAF